MSETVVQAIEHIVKTPGVCGGDARIAGRRIAVHFIVRLIYRLGSTVDELERAYDLTAAQIYAALAYYHDHREEIDAILTEEDEISARHEAGHSEEQRRMRQELRQRWMARHGGKDPDHEMTVTEISQEYGISPQAVRKACHEEWIPARKSGSTWLIRRMTAEARWGKPVEK